MQDIAAAPIVEPETMRVMSDDTNHEIVMRFVRGDNIGDIATFYGKNRATVERVLRQAHNRLLSLHRDVKADIDSVASAARDCDESLAKACDALRGRMDQAEAFRALSFWQRVRWIIRGEQ